MATLDLATIVRQSYEAFDSKDLDRMMSFAKPDARTLNVPFGARGTYREDTERWMKAFPDGKCEVTNLIVQGDCAICEFTACGTHTGPFKSPTGEIAATGREAEVPCVEVFRFRNGKISETKLYFDSASLMRQLGIGVGTATGQGRAAATTQQPRH
jgi:predicted ester cyclase